MDGGPDGVPALAVDPGQPGQGVVPVLRETEHLGQQSLGFQGQGFVPQVMVAHDGIIPGALHTKNGHMGVLLLCSLPIARKVGIVAGKEATIPLLFLPS